MATWAQKASTPTSDASAPVAPTPSSSASPSTAGLMLPPPPPSHHRPRKDSASKANTSDNWRASAKPVSSATPPSAGTKTAKAPRDSAKDQSVPEGDEGGWETVEKKDKATEKKLGAPRDGRRATFASSATAGGAGSGSGSSKKGKKPHEGKPRSKDKDDKRAAKEDAKDDKGSSKQALKPVTSWADDDQDALPALTPSFTATTAAVDPVPDSIDIPLLPEAVAATPTPTAPSSPTREEANPVEGQGEDKAEETKKKPAGPPKVNPWAVRKEQIAASAASNAAASTSAAPDAKDAATAAPPAATKSSKKKKAKATAASSNSATSAATPSNSTSESSPASDSAAASTPASTSAPAKPRPASTAGWSNTNVNKKGGPTVVAGEDATSWPAPEEVKEKKDESRERTKSQENKETQPKASSHGGKKKKGDKWIPIKADITVASANGGSNAQGSKTGRKAAGKPAAGDKKAQGGKKDDVSKDKQQQQAHPLPSKPSTALPKGAAVGAQALAKRRASGTAPQDGENSLRAAATSISTPSTSTSASPSIAHAQPPSDGAADSATPATTAAPSTTDSDTTKDAPSSASPSSSTAANQPHLPKTNATIPARQQAQIQPPVFPQQGFAGLSPVAQAFRGGMRGRGAMRGARGGRGGQNGFGGRPFVQQHSYPAQVPPPGAPPVIVQPQNAEPGVVPISVQLDQFGYPVLDSFGYPVPAGGGQAPVVQSQIPPGYIDPRMLDPTRYWLLGQLEWWFSVDNLCRDLFLRSKMDANGWVLISIIASFNRIKNLTSDIAIVVECLRMTPLLEVSPKGQHVRLRQAWPEWVLPNAVPNKDVEKEFEEAENEKKEKDAKKDEGNAVEKQDEELEEGEIREDKAESTETAQVEAAPTPAASDDAAVEAKVVEEGAKSVSGDEVSLRSPTLKTQASPPNHVSPKALPALPVLDTAVASVTTTSPKASSPAA
ncbi:hypothetical protein JCM10212_005827 [Sporobolomyces blumeae]